MAEITGSELVGDTFQADQASQGSVVANADGTYTFTSNGSLAGLADSITVTSAPAAPSEMFTSQVTGGIAGGSSFPATIIANGADDFLAEASIGGSTYYVYVTNDPADQPAQGASVPVGAIGADNPYTNPCFAFGTLIRTARGDIAVEDLAIGDLVVTTSGAHRPIRWLGHRRVDCARHPRPADVLPVLIAAHAFGDARPARDLLVSPGHAICVDALGEILIPAGALVDGGAICQVPVDTVTYWHVELDSHDILLAENLPAESYLEMANRGFFAENGTVVLAATPDAAVRTHADFCRAFHEAGPLVEAARRQLAARASSLSRRNAA